MMLRCLVLAPLVAALAGAASAEDGFDPQTREQKLAYALGLSIGQSLHEFRLSEEELRALAAGVRDATHGNTPKVALHVWKRRFEGFKRERSEQALARTRSESAAFIAEAARQPSAEQKPSGLIYREVAPGSGSSPLPTDTVSVHYHGTRPDGSVFDSTRGKQPASFELGKVIPCWTEALGLMKVGGVSQLVCPAQIAYGDEGFAPVIEPGQALQFEVELVSID